MHAYTDAELEAALAALADMTARTGQTQAKFAPGTAQHTLQRNRLAALAIAAALVRQALGQDAGAAGYPPAALEAAAAPLASLASKSGKAREKVAPGSWQHAMLTRNVQALAIAMPLLDRARAEAGTA